ncbi:MAG: two-component regulator propeller domain-containing protein [Pyrinomonadaceae bacterium]
MSFMNGVVSRANVRVPFPRLALLCLAFLCLAHPASALDPGKTITQYMHDVWTTEEGLPQNSVVAITQTRDGYLWFGSSEEGLARFDGVTFTLFNRDNTKGMSSNNMSALFEDNEGALWVGTSAAGLLRMKDGEFTAFTREAGLAADVITSIAQEKDGSLLVGTSAGLSRFRDGRFSTIARKDRLPDDVVMNVLRDRRDESIWVATRGGLAHLKDDQIKTYTTRDGLSHDQVTRIHQDRSGGLWLGTMKGLTYFKDNNFIRYGAGEGLVGEVVIAIREDADGNVWIGTSEGGLQRFRDGKFTIFAPADAPAKNNAVVAIYEDREGSLWFGTPSDGLHRLRDAKFTAYTPADGLSDDFIKTFYETRNGDFLIGTRKGLDQFKDGKFSRFPVPGALPANFIFALLEDRQGRLWTGTTNGFSVLEGGKLRNYTTYNGLSYSTVSAFYEDHAGDLWFGLAGGLGRLSGEDVTGYGKSKGFAGSLVLALHGDREGNLWIGSYYGGLSRFRDGEFTNYGAQEGVPSKSVASIYEDREGTLWIGTFDSGLIRLRDGKFTIFTQKDGLYDSKVFGVTEDDAGNFWMSSNKGIFRAPRHEFEEFAEGKRSRINCVAYGTADGMKNRECNGGGYRARDGRIWFPTVKGAVVIDPSRVEINEVPPPVHIESVTADSEVANTGGRAEFAPGKARFEFHYAGLSFVAPERVHYKYKLEGLDRDWTDAGARRTAYYTNIPPGDYKFRVIAANNDGVWNEQGAAFDFRLRPYFYQTRWFYLLCVLLLASLALGAYLLRVARLKRQRRRLVGMVEERTQQLIEEKEKLSEAYGLIEKDNERKTRELDEARALQLSMLPKHLPVLPNLEVAAYMKPATEVGGDYYDFHVGDDGTLTVAVGDATGHGLRAGTMVTATKSLFETLAGEPDLPQVFKRSNQVLKQMNMRALYMALVVLKIKDNRLRVCAAGMPPLLVYRAGARTVEEIALKAMPLGSVRNYTYEQQELSLAAGDTVMVMSDGFPEMFNEEGEMLDYEKAKTVLAEVALASPQEIINRFVEVGEQWADGRAQDDDVTFVVLKVKENGHPAPLSNS